MKGLIFSTFFFPNKCKGGREFASMYLELRNKMTLNLWGILWMRLRLSKGQAPYLHHYVKWLRFPQSDTHKRHVSWCGAYAAAHGVPRRGALVYWGSYRLPLPTRHSRSATHCPLRRAHHTSWRRVEWCILGIRKHYFEWISEYIPENVPTYQNSITRKFIFGMSNRIRAHCSETFYRRYVPLSIVFPPWGGVVELWSFGAILGGAYKTPANKWLPNSPNSATKLT